MPARGCPCWLAYHVPMLPTFTSLGSGPVLLMLHDVDASHLAFAPQVEHFAELGYQAVAWDMPGYGHSPPLEPYGFKGLAARCVALIEALTQGREGQRASVVLIGQGMGGMVAQEVALRRPDCVNRLVLSGCLAAFGDASADARSRYLQDRWAALDAGQPMETMAQRLVPRGVGPGALPEGARLAEFCWGAAHPSTYRRALAAAESFDRHGVWSTLSMPTLLISGSADALAPPAQVQAMAARRSDAWVEVLHGIGRWPNLEAPDAFDAAVLAFLADTAPGMRSASPVH